MSANKKKSKKKNSESHAKSKKNARKGNIKHHRDEKPHHTIIRNRMNTKTRSMMMKTTDYGQNTVHTAEHYDATQQSSKS